MRLPQRAGDAALAARARGDEDADADADALKHLPPKLAKEVDPYLSLDKDALWLPDGAAAADGGGGSGGGGGNALAAYTPVTRVAEALLSALQAHGQYAFVIAPEAGCDGAAAPRLQLAVSSWNGQFSCGGGALAPALRVHYSPAGDGDGDGDAAADVVLSRADFAAVCGALAETTAALPASRRRVAGASGAWLGFLALALADP